MRILMTGASGMLGHSLIKVLQQRHKLFCTSRSKPQYLCEFQTADLANAPFEELLDWSQPDLVIHGGAVTDVDLCERDPQFAHEVNVTAVKKLLQAMQPRPSRLFYISTEAVYAEQPFPYRYKESDERRVSGVYAQTKLQAEELIFQSQLPFTILRGTLVGYPSFSGKKSFVERFVESLRAQTPMSLFSNSYFNPIATDLLAQFIEQISATPLPSVLNVGTLSCISKYNFGIKLASALGFDSAAIKAVEMNDISGVRKVNQCLDISLAQKQGLDISIEQVIENLKHCYDHGFKQENMHADSIR